MKKAEFEALGSRINARELAGTGEGASVKQPAKPSLLAQAADRYLPFNAVYILDLRERRAGGKLVATNSSIASAAKKYGPGMYLGKRIGSDGASVHRLVNIK